METISPKESNEASEQAQSNKLLQKLSKSFHTMRNKLRSAGSNPKQIEFNGEQFQDSPDELYVPLDKHF